MRLVFLLFYLLPFLSGFAQNKYPIKLDHRWGFIDETGKVVTRPKYDRIGKELPYSQNNRRRRSYIYSVELNGKLGLVGRNGDEILAPEYYGIELLNDSTFLVKESIDTTKPILVNTKGKTLVKGNFEKAFPIKNGYYRLTNKGLWGVQHKGERMSIPLKYPWLKPYLAGKGYVAFSKNKKEKGLMDLEAKLILADEFTDIQVLNDSFFIATRPISATQKRIEFWDGQAPIALDSHFVSAQIIGPQLILLHDFNQKQTLYSATQQKILAPIGRYTAFRPMAGTDYISIKKGDRYGLMTKVGEVLIPTQFEQILPLTTDLFKVSDGLKMGIFKLAKGLVLPLEFDQIEAFKEGFAQVRKNEEWGLLNEGGQLIIQPEYQLLMKTGNLVKAYRQIDDFSKQFARPDTFTPEMDTYQLNEMGEVSQKEVYQNVYTIRVGYQVGINDYPEGVSNFNNNTSFSNNRRTSSTNNSSLKKDPEYQKNSIYRWYLHDSLNLWGVKHRQTGAEILPPSYSHISHIPFTDLTLVTSPQHPIIGAMDTLLQNYEDSLGISASALFSHIKGKFITSFELSGLQTKDLAKENPYAAFIDKTGQFALINSQGQRLKAGDGQALSYIGSFENGIAPAALGGQYVKECESDSCMTPLFNKELMAKFHIIKDPLNANMDNGFNINFAKWGYIDTLGNWFIPPVYEYVQAFVDGIALAKKGDFWGMIDLQQNPVLAFEYADIQNFQNNKYLLIKNNKQPIFYNQEGKVIIGKQYDKFGEFSEGLCWVRKDSLWGFIDKNGEEVIQCQYQAACDFGQGRAAVRKNNQWFFINKRNQRLLDAPNDAISFRKYSHHKIAYKAKNGKYGYLDWNGQIAIPPIYSVAFDYHRDLARAAFNKKTGLLDTLGQYVMKPKLYDLVFDFNEHGLAHAYEQNDGLLGLINRQGKEVVGMKYKIIEPFKNAYAKVLGLEGYGLIDTNGNEVIPAIYESLGEPSEGVIAVRPYHSYEWTYMTLDHQVFLKENFTLAHTFVNGRSIVTRFQEGNIHYIMIDKKGNEIKNFGTSRQLLHQNEGIIGIKVGKSDSNQREYCYYINTDGEKIFDRNFAAISPFQNGIALVKNKKSRWGMINTYGHEVITNKYHQLEQKEEDIILAYNKRLMGICDTKGKILLQPDFDVIKRVGLLYQIEKEDGIGYLDLEANWVWELKR